MYITEEKQTKKISYRSASDPMYPIPYRVVEKRTENTDLITLVLEPAGQEAIEPLLPGQFNMLYLFGIGEIQIGRAHV